ncbi:ABC transporter substrate-binding protein [Sphingomicrobium lutaoense]|uniref:Peptide/nickel transport system substrate-binding protein n=1 Tax=Sphingomicrobium lutaoense TaxID=515949 RepID=A0A839Z0G6_9SPHN|nr:ABC transporter substrate-binding protein [Sphingomicrobium lutaoense]MBB3764180.1 peptide/nickel transport system substrate-binding protein [Sphingomicrobium lutaoense]
MLRTPTKFLLPILALSLASCGDDNPGETHIALIDERAELTDPATGRADRGDEYLLGALAQGLVRFDARGQIEGALAERWHVSDDGRSYIFRLASGSWPDGEPIEADDVARALRRQIAARRNPLHDTMGVVEDVVAMTDRVIELRLSSPRPDLLSLLAQPEMAILKGEVGAGPFLLSEADDDANALHLSRLVPNRRTDEMREEMLHLTAASAQRAVGLFSAGSVELVLGGTFTDLPLARGADLSRGELRFDPVLGLFGLLPRREKGPLADPSIRSILSRAIDREAFLADLAVPGLVPRARILQAGLDIEQAAQPPAWLELPLTERQDMLARNLRSLVDDDAQSEGGPVLQVALHLPDGPGGDMLFNRLSTDWGRIGVEARRVEDRADADFTLIDQVAPSRSGEWFIRFFRCGSVRLCSKDADALMDDARAAPTVEERHDLLTRAAMMLDEAELFIPIAAPVRWALVGPYVTGFSPNSLARHPLMGLKGPLSPENAP